MQVFPSSRENQICKLLLANQVQPPPECPLSHCARLDSMSRVMFDSVIKGLTLELLDGKLN